MEKGRAQDDDLRSAHVTGRKAPVPGRIPVARTKKSELWQRKRSASTSEQDMEGAMLLE